MVVRNVEMTQFRDAALSMIPMELRKKAMVFLHALRTLENEEDFSFPPVDPAQPIEVYTTPEEKASYYQRHFALNAFMDLHPLARKDKRLAQKPGVMLYKAYEELSNPADRVEKYNSILSKALKICDEKRALDR